MDHLIFIIILIVILLLIILYCVYYFYYNYNYNYNRKNDDLNIASNLHIIGEDYGVLEYCSEDKPYMEPIVYDNFITYDEADYIINQAQPLFTAFRILNAR